MNRLGPRARLVVGVLLAVLAIVGGFLFTGSGDDSPEAELVPTHDGSSPSVATGTASASPRFSSDEVQRLTVDEDGNIVVLPSAAPTATASSQTAAPRGVVPAPVPDAAWVTLAEIDAGRWPDSADAPGTRGGDTWQNREGLLPRTDAAGVKIVYREWDVNPKRRGETRDAERIVTGSDAAAWYTGDHYESFTRMR